MRTRSTALGVLALVTVGALTACGDDSSTSDGSDAAPSAFSSPSVVVPANPTDTSGAVATTTPNPHSGGAAGAMDGGISEVTELPPAASVRTADDDAFLAQLRDNGIDVDDQIMQDQVIAAAHEQCQANSEGRESFSVPAVAGQLRELGVTDKDPEAASVVIRDAAEANYCS